MSSAKDVLSGVKVQSGLPALASAPRSQPNPTFANYAQMWGALELSPIESYGLKRSAPFFGERDGLFECLGI